MPLTRKFLDDFKALVRVNVLQRKDLSHTQFIFFLASDSKTMVLQPSFVNTIIPAEIPNTSKPLSRWFVFKHNIQNLRGEFNSSVVFLDDGICTKRFLKQFVEETDHRECQVFNTYSCPALEDGGKTAPCWEPAPWTYRVFGGDQIAVVSDNS